MLTNLLDQDPAAVLGWLARHGASASQRHAGELAWAGPSATFWQRRAEASAALLAEVADQAAEVVAAVHRGETSPA